MKGKNNLLDKLFLHRLFRHSIFWLFVLLIAPLTSGESITEIGEALLYRGVALPTKIIAAYLLAYYLIPQLFQKKKYVQFLIAFTISTVLLTILYRINNVHIAEVLAGNSSPKESLWEIITDFEYTVLSYFTRLYFFAFIFIFLKMIKDRSLEQHQLETLQKEKATTELNFLKAQMHPHFLFNTLNNLYALTLDKSDQAPEVVEKLSEMLDYMLYQCKADKVLISKEVELLEHYIDLEKLRYGNRLQLKFEHDIDHTQTLIAPLILVSIIENAFKHGVSDTIQPALIRINLTVDNQVLTFKVFNTKNMQRQADAMGYKEGIGVKNVNRQLELIYPHQYTWQVNEQEESYEVLLTITL